MGDDGQHMLIVALLDERDAKQPTLTQIEPTPRLLLADLTDRLFAGGFRDMQPERCAVAGDLLETDAVGDQEPGSQDIMPPNQSGEGLLERIDRQPAAQPRAQDDVVRIAGRPELLQEPEPFLGK